MAITVTHSKVSTIPDGDDPSVVRPSDWNADHTLVGLGTMAEQNANAVDITGGTISGVSVSGYVPTSRTLTASTGLTGGGDLSANRTFAIANTGVTAASYGSSSKTLTATVNAQGQLTTLADTNIAIANTQVSGLGTASTKDAGVALGVATLDAAGKVPLSEIPDSIIGALSYQGTWNASTNTPTLTSSVGTKGYYYVVSVAGTTDLNGITDWQVGDWAVYNGTAWQKIDNTDSVTSVNGFTGAVVLTTTNIAEGTNEYFTTARARASVSAGTGISYNSTTGVITNSSPSLGGDVVGPASATDNAIARYDTTTGKLIQNSGVTIDDNANIAGIRSTQYSGAIPATQPIGTMWFDSATDSLNFQQNAITQQIGEELFVYGKASAAITDSPLQIIYHTGTVGASGVITFAPTVAGITDENAIIGVATESIALNGFGRITAFGVVHGINTTGSAYGETWANDDVIWYNPVTGNPTKVKPVAPNIKFQIGLVINAGSGGSGSFQVLLQPGTQLGGTDSNVQLTTPTAAQILTYSTSSNYWKNTSLTAGIGISVGATTSGVLTVTNTAPSQWTTTGSDIYYSTGSVFIGISTPEYAEKFRVYGNYSTFDNGTFKGFVGAGTTLGTSTASDFAIRSENALVFLAGGATERMRITTTGGVSFGATGTAYGTSGQVLTSAGNAPPTWTTPTTGTVTSVSGTGSVNGITLTGTVTSSGSLTLGGTLGSIANSQLTNSSITINGSSVSLGGSTTVTATATNALTIGSYLTGTSYNGSTAVTIAADATSANTASKLVARDASGNFSASVITATSYVGVSGGTF